LLLGAIHSPQLPAGARAIFGVSLSIRRLPGCRGLGLVAVTVTLAALGKNDEKTIKLTYCKSKRFCNAYSVHFAVQVKQT